jgi:hypothetical protein
MSFWNERTPTVAAVDAATASAAVAQATADDALADAATEVVTAYMLDLTVAGGDDTISVVAPITGNLTRINGSATFAPDQTINLLATNDGQGIADGLLQFIATLPPATAVSTAPIGPNAAVTANSSVILITHDTPANTVAGHITLELEFTRT